MSRLLKHKWRGALGRKKAWTPANLGASLLSWHESVSGYVFADTSFTPATDGGGVARRIDRRDTSGAQSYPLADKIVGTNPTWTKANNSLTYDGASALRYSAASTLSGAYTLYAIGTRGLGQSLVAFGYSGADNFAMIFADNQAYLVPAGGSPPYTGATGLILARWRRDASNNTWFAATSMAEISVGAQAASMVVDTEGERPAASQFTTSGLTHVARLIVAADTVTGGQDAQIRAYLLANFGAGL